MNRVVLCLVTAVVGVVLTVASTAAPAATAFKVTSTLDGKKVLPLRIRWKATPHISTSQVKKVEFLIDGHWLWTEHSAPYYYGGNEGNRGNWLITSFLKPGRHTFTARVFTIGGPTESDNVQARVIQAPPPPSELAGTWKHHLSSSTCKAARGFCDKNGDHSASITILGWGTPPGDFWDARYESGTRVVFGPWLILPHMSAGARLGGFCNGIDPYHAWTYTIASDDQSFQVHPIGTDSCPDRQNLLEGTWTRVG